MVDHVVGREQLLLDLPIHLDDLIQPLVDLFIFLFEFVKSLLLLQIYFWLFIVLRHDQSCVIGPVLFIWSRVWMGCGGL